MTKDRYIEKYGEAAWEIEHERRKEYCREYWKRNKEKLSAQNKERYIADRDRRLEALKQYRKEHGEEVRQKDREYYARNAEKKREQKRQSRLNNKEQTKIISKRYRETHKETVKGRLKAYYENNRERLLDYAKEYRDTNRDTRIKKQREYFSTKKGRAKNILAQYKRKDMSLGLETNITDEWIIKNIFSGQKCVYCGENDWKRLGCDRIDNSVGHTEDNCICACGLCNIERGDRMGVEEFKQYRQLHPRLCDTPKEKAPILNEKGALTKRVVNL